MSVGFGAMRLSSAAFWSLTPRELAAALEILDARAAPPARAGLNELMNRFPDRA
jgi:uncharacterized phage protein (TIGR02216 family)